MGEGRVMPKNTAQRRIDSRRQNRATTISGITLSGSPGTGGSAALAGDGLSYDGVALNVGAGTLLTVGTDDIGITAGANYQFIGTGAGTAAAWQNLSTLAGAGLTHSAGVLAVGAGNGITVSADAVALTTPGTLTVATSNNAASNHTHAITSSSNPGAAASILASTASGGLTLQSLAVQGSVDVTNGGDLTVAGSGSYAGSTVLFVDSSGGNVGIMGAPDPQFALDVVGPCRATWFVGPHAIQLKDVLLLSHFDGRMPFATNFSGEVNGHMGQVGTTAYTGNAATYRAGKFGTKAIQIAPAVTNYVTNPSFESNVTTGWSLYEAGTGAARSQSTNYSVVGSACAVLSASTVGPSRLYNYSLVTIANGESVAANCWVRAVTTGASTTFRIVRSDGVSLASDTVTTTDEWQYVHCTYTNSSGGNQTVGVAIDHNTGGSTSVLLIDAVQLTKTTYNTPYADGSMGFGHSWAGTAHASTSARTDNYLLYPIAGNIDRAKGTVMMWCWIPGALSSGSILWTAGDANGELDAYVIGSPMQVYFRINGDTSVVANIDSYIGQWVHLAFTWDYENDERVLYVNGVEADSATVGARPTLHGTYIGVGYSPILGTGNLYNGWIDDFVITDSPMAADGIRAVYESDAPVFAESSRFSFRATPQGLVWADDEGLWMRNASGSAVFGAYGGAATKSWAGLTLSPSDIVMGDSSRGSYAWWDDSAGAFAIGRSGTDRVKLTSAGVLSINDSGGNAVFTFDASAGAEFTKPLTMATTGGIYQGTGTFASPTTGLKIWNDSGVGRIGGYNSGNLQWYASTTGYFYSGAGTMRIGSDDIRLQLGTYDGDYDDYRFIRWVPTIDGSDTAITDFDYRAHVTAWANTATQDTVNLQMSSRVNAGDYDTREARTLVAANNWNGSALHYAELAVIQKDSGDNYLGVIRMIQNVLEVDLNSAPTGNPPTGYIWVWWESGATMKTRDSGGTTRSVTFS